MSPPRSWERPGAPSATSTAWPIDRKSTRLNSSHQIISYAVFCLKKKKTVTVMAGPLINGRQLSILVRQALESLLAPIARKNGAREVAYVLSQVCGRVVNVQARR